MKKLILFACVLIISCSNKKSDNINLFNKISFKLYENEDVASRDEQVIKTYDYYLNNYTDIQIPLFKYIKHKDYEIFIGIPFSTSISDIKNIELTENDNLSIICNKSDSLYLYQQIKMNNLYVTKYFSNVGSKPSLLYFAAITKSKKISDSLFKRQEIEKRITNKNIDE